jgi:hypothetical protein
MRFRIIASSLAVTLLAAGLASAGDSPGKKRKKTREMAAHTLQDPVQSFGRKIGSIKLLLGIADLPSSSHALLLPAFVPAANR